MYLKQLDLGQGMPTQRRKKEKGVDKKVVFKQMRLCVWEKRRVNQAFKNLDKTAPALIQNLKGELNDVLQQGIHQVIRERVVRSLKKYGPQLLKGVIEDAYKTPFRLLGNFKKNRS